MMAIFLSLIERNLIHNQMRIIDQIQYLICLDFFIHGLKITYQFIDSNFILHFCLAILFIGYYMAIKNESNNLSECAELVLDSASVGFAAAGLFNPVAGLIAPLFSVGALPFAFHNSSFTKRKINEIIAEVNKHEIRLSQIEELSEKQNEMLALNSYKFFDYCLKEKMRAKIQAYAIIFSKSINDGSALEEDDLFDIKIDLINSLRKEDIELLNTIFSFCKDNHLSAFECHFKKNDISAYLFYSEAKKELNEYAFKHLITLGLISERLKAKLPNVVGEKLSFNDNILYDYSLNQRCKLIYDAIVDSA